MSLSTLATIIVDKLPRLLCARCGNIAIVHWVTQRVTTDELLLWVQCHKHALVLLPCKHVGTEQPPVELIGLKDVSSEALRWFEAAEALMLAAAEQASALERFLKKVWI